MLFPIISFAEDFDIENYNVSIDMKKDSMIEVSEEITAKFYKPRHGIFRFIPIVYKNDNIKGTTSLDIFDVEVFKKSNDQQVEWKKENFSLTNRNQNLFIKIGKENLYVNDLQRYLIKYKVYNTLDRMQDKDIFSWNITGNDWPVKIKSVNFNLKLPLNIYPIKDSIIFYIGKFEDKKFSKIFDYNEDQISFYLGSELSLNEGITVFLDFDKNLFLPIPFAQKIKVFLYSYWRSAYIFVTLLICFFIWLCYGKDDYTAIPVEFYPLNGFDSAMFGFLLNDSLENSELLSLIFYWATNGYIKIHDEEIVGRGEKDTSLIKIKDLPENAPIYQKTLFNRIFIADEVSLKDLQYKLIDLVKTSNEEIRKILVSKGVYTESSIKMKKMMLNFLVVAGLFLFILNLIYSNNIVASVATLHGMFFLLPILIVFMCRIMLKKTFEGNQLYAKAQGFKNFINSVEKPQIEVLMKEEPDYFNKALPYAVALGISNDFVKKFEGILKEPPSWYESNTKYFSFNKFDNVIQSGISSANNMFNVKSSRVRGDFCGGAFSGGGHGGGGGGSW